MARSHVFAAVRHPQRPQILILRSDRAWRLPHTLLAAGAWAGDSKVVVPAFERRLGTRLWLLRRIDGTTDEEAAQSSAVLHELELLDAEWEAPTHGRWVGHAELARLRLKDEEQRPVIAAYLDALERGVVPEQRSPWARPGWHAEVRPWIEDEVARLGHAVVAIEQVKHWSISSVLRIETDGPDVYFKVPSRLPLFVEEATVTARLAERFPDHVPAPLAVDPERGWLLLPAFDELFQWSAPLAQRQEVLRRFARLQRATCDLTDHLLADGCLDRRLDVLETQIEPLLHDPEAVARLSADEAAELRRLAPALKELCRRLARLGPPPSLVHGDLHMLNVARLGGALVYFDWTDACIAHPFTDLHTLQWEKDDATRAALLDAYLEGWAGAEEPERLREALSLASVVTPLHHAVSYRHIVTGLERQAKPELDATHEFLREALRCAGQVLAARLH